MKVLLLIVLLITLTYCQELYVHEVNKDGPKIDWKVPRMRPFIY